MWEQGRSQDFSLGWAKYRFQNFGKCNVGEYPLPPGDKLSRGGVGTFRNYLNGYVPPKTVVILNVFVYFKTRSVVLLLNLSSLWEVWVKP